MSDETNSPPPEVTPKNAAPPAAAQVYSAWAEAHSTPDWLLAAARHKANWPEGREVSEADYLKALEDAQNEAVT